MVSKLLAVFSQFARLLHPFVYTHLRRYDQHAVLLLKRLILRGVPAFIRSDNGPEFIAEAVQKWIKAVGAKTAYQARHGRTDTVKASMRVSGMNC